MVKQIKKTAINRQDSDWVLQDCIGNKGPSPVLDSGVAITVVPEIMMDKHFKVLRGIK